MTLEGGHDSLQVILHLHPSLYALLPEEISSGTNGIKIHTVLFNKGEGGREGKIEGGREGKREGGREGKRKGGREGKREGGRERTWTNENCLRI